MVVEALMVPSPRPSQVALSLPPSYEVTCTCHWNFFDKQLYSRTIFERGSRDHICARNLS